MFRFGIVVALISVLLLSACGGGGSGGGSSSSSSGSGGSANASAQGKTVFTTNCKGCHTLDDAGATGSVGPNLEELQPDKATAVRQVDNGGGLMSAFHGQHTDAPINPVAALPSFAGRDTLGARPALGSR